MGLIGKDGKWILPAEYDEIQDLGSAWLVDKEGKKGLLGSDLSVWLNLEFDEIRAIQEPGIYECIKDGLMLYFHAASGQIFWTEQNYSNP